MLKFIILTGENQGTEVKFFEGQKIGDHESCDFKVKSPLLKNTFLDVWCRPSGNLVISSHSKKAIIKIGGESLTELDLVPGLVFSIGEIGFSIQEGDASATKDNKAAPPFNILKTLNTNVNVNQKVFALKKPIVLKFVRGSLINTHMNLSWSPFKIGAKSTLHHFIDENLNLEDDLIQIEKKPDFEKNEALITPYLSNFISINKKLISKPTKIKNGDLIEFSDTAFYIKIS